MVGDVPDGASNGLGPVMVGCWGRCACSFCGANWDFLFDDINGRDGVLVRGGRGLSRADLASGVFG